MTAFAFLMSTSISRFRNVARASVSETAGACVCVYVSIECEEEIERERRREQFLKSGHTLTDTHAEKDQ